MYLYGECLQMVVKCYKCEIKYVNLQCIVDLNVPNAHVILIQC